MLRLIQAGTPPDPPVVIQLWLGSAVARDAPDRVAREATLCEILGGLPRPHLELLAEVPILIVSNLPGGRARGGGGWYPPTDGNPTMDVWFSQTSQAAREAPPDQLRSLRYSRGIIGWKDFRFLERPHPDDERRRIVPIGLSILHEVGHCVDRYLDLDSPSGQPAYRCGLRPYEGLRYGGGGGYDGYEFKAEAYARALRNPAGICRGNHDLRCEEYVRRYGTPCAVRLQTDLKRTPAFRMLPDPYRYLPQALRSVVFRDAPLGTVRVARSYGLARPRPPGPTGMSEEADTGGTPGPLGVQRRLA